ncbi:hypothetical protein M8J76_004262 [Diaphorina citri]|nr:hypothetical protein M8J75_006148 [Diaphorina citri]KAI5723321.1 hypothetical protein M8J76_004262 [Diaphorina citri]KAI5729172.1 hypothetical protein M8J77_026348 [Diaphorina citri]
MSNSEDGETNNNLTKKQNEPFNLWTYEPNRREQAILDECSRVAFLRFLPLAAMMGFGTVYGIQNGYFRPNTRFGALPKLTAMTAASYVISKLSVAGECADAIKSLRKSPLAEYIKERERRR